MRVDERVLLAIFAGGFCGAVARALVVEALPYESGHWPWATLLVNVAGALLLGYVITRVEDGREPFTHAGRLLGTGFCGALTTFSAMQLELLQMLDDDRHALAVAYALVSVAAGLSAVALATRLTRDRRASGKGRGMSPALLLAIGLLGGAGAVARFLVVATITGRAARRTALAGAPRRRFALGILVVNLSGAFLLGTVVGAAVRDDAYSLVATGLLGSYTTFSSWVFDSDRLARDGGRHGRGAATLNIAASLGLGLLAVWLGRELGGML